jgi:hypothetical protein
VESSVPLPSTVCFSGPGEQCSHSDSCRRGLDWRRHNARTHPPVLEVIRVLSTLAYDAG